MPPGICAGCGEPIRGIVEEVRPDAARYHPAEPALELADGNRVHLADGYECLLRYGERWRGKARAAVSQTPAATGRNASLSASFADVGINRVRI